MKKKKVLLLLLIIGIALVCTYDSGLFEIIPDTHHVGCELVPASITVNAGETIAVRIIVPNDCYKVTHFNLYMYDDDEDNSFQYVAGWSRQLTSNTELWMNTVSNTGNPVSIGFYDPKLVDAGETIYGMVKPSEKVQLLKRDRVGGGSYIIHTGNIEEIAGSFCFSWVYWKTTSSLFHTAMVGVPGIQITKGEGYALEFKIPSNPSFSSLSGLALYKNPSGGGMFTSTTYAKIGFSKIMTMDTSKWECVKNFYPSFSSGWLDMFDYESIVCQPGETWYIMIKMQLASEDHDFSLPYSIYTYDDSGYKCYKWADYNINSYTETKPLAFKVYVQRDEPFYVDFKYSPTNPEPGESIQFTDTSHPELISSWEWVFGPGQYSYEQNPTHIYEEEGTYTVTLTGKSIHGTPIEINKQLTVAYQEQEEPAPPEEIEWWMFGLIGLLGIIGLVALKRKRIF